jgi:hypothetical protein
MGGIYAAARKIARGKKFGCRMAIFGLAGVDAPTLLSVPPEKSVKILLSLRGLTLLE